MPAFLSLVWNHDRKKGRIVYADSKVVGIVFPSPFSLLLPLKQIFGVVFWMGIFIIPIFLSGCASGPAEKVPSLMVASTEEYNLNPLFVRVDNPEWVWEGVIDVLENYFPIEHESPIQSRNIRNKDNVISTARTEGRIETKPVIAAGVLQPWKKNSVDINQRLEATFQTIRRYAIVRIVPEENGFMIHLAVYNELENLPRPMNSQTSGSHFTFTDDLSQMELPTGPSAPNDGWIPMGRNCPLEQYILQEIAWRLNNPPVILNPQQLQKKEQEKLVP